MGFRVAVQDRQRFYREGLIMVLAEEPDLEPVGAAADARGLTRLFEDQQPGVVVLELDASEWDACRLVAALRKRRRTLVVVGLARSCDRVLAMRATQAGVRAIVTRDRGIGAILQAVRSSECHSVVAPLATGARRVAEGDTARATSLAAAPAPAASLTPRQLDVLRLVGSGFTTREISEQLLISPKTVENHKQRIFERLDVHNQAHAVAVAMRAGLVSHVVSSPARNAS